MDTTLKWHRIIQTKRQVHHQCRRIRVILAHHQHRRVIPPRILPRIHPEVDRQETAEDRRKAGDVPKKVVVTTAPSGVVWNTAKIGVAVVTRIIVTTNVRRPPDERGHRAGRSRHHRLPTRRETAVVIAVEQPQPLMLVVLPKATQCSNSNNKVAFLLKAIPLLSWASLNNTNKGLMVSRW